MSTTPARRRATAVVVGVLLALTGVLLCKPWVPAGPQQAAAAPVGTAPVDAAPVDAAPVGTAPAAADPATTGPATAPFRTDADGSTRVDDATGLDGSGAPGCQERDRDTGSQPAVPPRSGPSQDHVSLLAERPRPDCRTVLSVVHTRPAVTAAALTAPTPVELSVLRV
ncbi:hypothetical protein ABT112_24745 [Streptomyces sp. NPDC002055]|uniref:hypothetical protein n=1 Tax=Streptomyces sp. NPDC002055 TaxID=3154534 RepID=UPI003330061C